MMSVSVEKSQMSWNKSLEAAPFSPRGAAGWLQAAKESWDLPSILHGRDASFC